MRYIGTIIWNIVSVIFSIAILNAFYGDFEAVTTAILVIIWATINQGFTYLGLNTARQSLFIYSKIKNIPPSTSVRRLEKFLLDESDSEEKEKDIDEFEKAEKTLGVLLNKFYIAVVGNAIIWIVAIIKILESI
jgi:hypothetical protein